MNDAPAPAPRLRKAYMDVILVNLRTVWTMEDAIVARQAKAVGEMQEQYVEESKAIGETNQDATHQKWGKLWPCTVHARLMYPERGIKGTAFAAWWSVVRHEVMVRERGMQELAARRVQSQRRSQVTKRNEKAVVRVQAHSRGLLARNNLQEKMRRSGEKMLSPPIQKQRSSLLPGGLSRQGSSRMSLEGGAGKRASTAGGRRG